MIHLEIRLRSKIGTPNPDDFAAMFRANFRTNPWVLTYFYSISDELCVESPASIKNKIEKREKKRIKACDM